jgi:hypothetical protein
MATLETRAHLSLLVARGQLTRVETDGVAVYGTHQGGGSQ